jgi:hypothetical protein
MARVVAIAGAYGDQMKNLRAYYIRVPRTGTIKAPARPKSENSIKSNTHSEA